MNRSPGKRIVIPAVTVAAGLALLAGSVLGGPAEDGPGPPAPPPGGPLVLKAERVADPATAKAGDNPRVFYLETTTPVDDIPPGPYGYIVKRCPNDSRAINGYYFQTTEGGNGQPVGVYHGLRHSTIRARPHEASTSGRSTSTTWRSRRRASPLTSTA